MNPSQLPPHISQEDIETAVSGSPYEVESSLDPSAPPQRFDPQHQALLNAARALELERALIKMTMINFHDLRSISEAFKNARATIQKWGQL